MIVGMDPGKDGGMVFYSGQPDLMIAFSKTTNHEIAGLLRDVSNVGEILCFVERVGVGPSMPGSGAFKFGKTCGILEGILSALEIPYELISPVKWQSHYGLIQRGMPRGSYDKKKINRAKAQQLYPKLTITNATADALLIARYGWETTK